MRNRIQINPLKWLGHLFTPIQKNSAFFVFMFALGLICTHLELMPVFLIGKGAKPYELAVPELFLDLYVVCLILTLIPQKIRFWVRGICYILLYATAIVDMYCYVRFESTLTPTMLMLANETTGQEASEFLKGYLSWDIITSKVGWILLLILVHSVWTTIRKLFCKMSNHLILPKMNPIIMDGAKAIVGLVTGWCLFTSIQATWSNKEAMHRMFTYNTVGQVEHELTRKDNAKFYVPIYRLVFSIFANKLADHQIVQLEAASEKVQVDSCSYRVPNIVLIIGESYNKHHSQLYGYNMPTTPRQMAMAQEGSLM